MMVKVAAGGFLALPGYEVGRREADPAPLGLVLGLSITGFCALAALWMYRQREAENAREAVQLEKEKHRRMNKPTVESVYGRLAVDEPVSLR